MRRTMGGGRGCREAGKKDKTRGCGENMKTYEVRE
jgi:hypothetical protein